MSAGNWFWILYVVCVIFGGWNVWGTGDRRWIGGSLVIFILVGLLGWGIFGSPLK